MAFFDSSNEEGLFEGCGREGPILSIFIAEFHHIAGPKIVYQYPADIIQKEVFDSVSTYIIPKTHLQRITMTVNVLGKKIIGYPIQIQNDKYERNAFYFNTCFVCDAWARTVQYERVLVKLAEFFNTLELEIEYLSKTDWGVNSTGEAEKELKEMFSAIILGINSPNRECSFVFQNRLLALKVVPAVLSDPPWPESHSVPVFVSDVGPIDRWDLTTQQIIPYVDGFNHVAHISHLAEVHMNLVKTCLQNLLYYNLIKMIPAFQYSNMYCVTPNFHSKLMQADAEFKIDCLTFVARSEHVRPSFADVVRFYCALKRGVTVKELCLRFRQVAASAAVRLLLLDPKISSSKYSDHSLSSSAQSRTSSNPTTPIKLHTAQSLSTRASLSKRHISSEFQSILTVIDERKLILFGLLHNLVRRIEKYPVFAKKDSGYQVGMGINSMSYYSSMSMGPQTLSRQHSHHYSTYNNIITMNANGQPDPNSENDSSSWVKFRKKWPNLYNLFDGSHSFDQICLGHGLSQNELDEIIEQDPDVVTIWK